MQARPTYGTPAARLADRAPWTARRPDRREAGQDNEQSRQIIAGQSHGAREQDDRRDGQAARAQDQPAADSTHSQAMPAASARITAAQIAPPAQIAPIARGARMTAETARV